MFNKKKEIIDAFLFGTGVMLLSLLFMGLVFVPEYYETYIKMAFALPALYVVYAVVDSIYVSAYIETVVTSGEEMNNADRKSVAEYQNTN